MLVNCTFFSNNSDLSMEEEVDSDWGGGEGATGGLDTLKNNKNIGFLSNTGPDSLKNHSFECWVIIGMPAKRHLNCVLLAG